jgi:hypothetical protein
MALRESAILCWKTSHDDEPQAFTLGAWRTLALQPRFHMRKPSQTPQSVLCDWYKLVLKLVRHTPTYSPPVASRSFAYLGITAFEAVAGGRRVALAGRPAERLVRHAAPRDGADA